MTVRDLATLQSALASGTIAPVYLFYGNEPGVVRAAVDAVRSASLGDGLRDFDHERFEGRELDDMGRVLGACTQVPMMAPRRVVELDAPEAVGKGGAEVAKKAIDALVAYVAAPCPSTVLVLCSYGIDGRSRLVTSVKKTGVVLKIEPLRRDRDAVDFIREQARARGLSVAPRVVEAMVARVGTRQSDLIAALERSALHAGDGKSIGDDDVCAVAGHTREAVVFDLTDAVGMGDADEALAVLADLFRESSNQEIGQANMLLAMLIRQFRLLMTAKLAGGNPTTIATTCAVPPFVARKLAAQSKRWDFERIRAAYVSLARFDRDLKGGAYAVSRRPYIALQRFVLEACGELPGIAPRS